MAAHAATPFCGWSPPLVINLALHDERMGVMQRCALRFRSLKEAQAACLKTPQCGGITRDSGLYCERERMEYEMRSGREIFGTANSWLPISPDSSGNCSSAEQSVRRKLAHKLAYEGKAHGGSRGGGGAQLLPTAERHSSVLSDLKLSTREPTRWSSSRLCDGPCCSMPLHRNRTCAFRDLLFVPPNRFVYLSDKKLDPATHGTFLHNRFSDGSQTGTGRRGYFAPEVGSPDLAARVTKVIESPVYIGADIHSNIAHLMLDSVFPSVISLLRLNAKALGAHRNISLPDAVTGSFTFLVYDAPGLNNWHRGRKERTWTEQLAGGGVVDVVELAQACPSPGCIIRSAWAGAGHVGLCGVDAQNIMGGSRQHRALFRFRHRIFNNWGVAHGPPTPAERGADGGLPTVLVVQSKRIVTNLNLFVNAINAAGVASARLIKWETMSFKDQLSAMRNAAVQVSGVGSAQINQFLLPRGAVAVCLGWRNENAKHGIHYFDHRETAHPRTPSHSHNRAATTASHSRMPPPASHPPLFCASRACVRACRYPPFNGPCARGLLPLLQPRGAARRLAEQCHARPTKSCGCCQGGPRDLQGGLSHAGAREPQRQPVR